MSCLVLECEEGCVVDHQRVLNEIYQFSIDQRGMVRKLRVKKDLFLIDCPFRMDTEVRKATRQQEIIDKSEKLDLKKRKRKRKGDLNEGERKAMEYHSKVSHFISETYQYILQLDLGTIFIKSSIKTTDNNSLARQAAAIEGPGDVFVELCTANPSPHHLCDITEVTQDTGLPSDIVHRCMCYKADKPQICQSIWGDFVLPPRCQFVMSDIAHTDTLVQGTKYDIIVMDPPWINKSIKRKKMYNTLHENDLLQLPIPQLASPGCLVVVWVTSKQKQQQFVKEILFPHWSVQIEAEWHWLKVTISGEPVYNIDSTHRKPYETILIGRFAKDNNQSSTANTLQALPKSKLIVSVPCSLHSRKPYLGDLLKTFVKQNPLCLEMFARNLHTDWTSWGNEVLKFQHLDYFEEIS